MEFDQAIDSVLDHKSLKYTPLAGSSYIKLPKELDHPKNALINIQNSDDNQCFKQCLIIYLIPADYCPGRTKIVIKTTES